MQVDVQCLITHVKIKLWSLNKENENEYMCQGPKKRGGGASIWGNSVDKI